ncbi:MAG: hypothetical protein AUK44_00755 [Porphyromonadaceae bacterium CG2_30_38_12]|nr:MAG: hypothetical protein AUK44_00755 [Porphyromonadaceae bacterium CG2_30_38_12]
MRYSSILVAVICLTISISPIWARKNVKKSATSSIVTVGNGASQLAIDLQGGAIVDFHVTNSTVNPFTWKVTNEQMPANNKSGAIFQGHFLCTGRWGAPTEGEMKAGVPHNGQASRDKWKVLKKTPTSVEMYIKAPLDGIEITRTVKLNKNENALRVTETFYNYTSIGRMFNVVQHATVGAPFLDDSLLVFTNAGKGFMQHLSYPYPNQYSYNWPMAYNSTGADSIDLRLSDTPDSYVSTHIFKDSIGWVVAVSPTYKLSLVYAWKTSEYPWINIWQERVAGKLWAKGLEFGTAGIGRSYQELFMHNTSFGSQNSFVFLDAKKKLIKSYQCWLVNETDKTEIIKNLTIK